MGMLATLERGTLRGGQVTQDVMDVATVKGVAPEHSS